MHNRFKTLAVAIFASSLFSCGPTVVPSSGPRPPLTADEVKIYQKKPSKYEDLGLLVLKITPELSWDNNGDANAAFDRMKASAAALGANGLLLELDPSSYDFVTTAGYHSTFYGVPMKKKIAYGEAIFVLKE